MLLDQRGCGKSRPHANITNNTTWHLVSDIEALRTHLGISKWHTVFGGSWGSTLSLAYAQAHPSTVGSLILRGIFTVRQIELNWSNQPGGLNMLFPDKYAEFIAALPEDERSDHIRNYHKRITSDDPRINLPAATAWNKYETSISTLQPRAEATDNEKDPAWQLAHARLEIHYFTHKAWLDDGQLLTKENIDKIRHIPGMFPNPLPHPSLTNPNISTFETLHLQVQSLDCATLFANIHRVLACTSDNCTG